MVSTATALPDHSPSLTHNIRSLATCTPPCPGRAWQSAAHPYLPLLAVAGSDKTVRIYSLLTFRLLSTITGGHKRSVRSVAWKPGTTKDTQSVLATGSFDATVGIWKGDNAKRRIGGGAKRAHADGGGRVPGAFDDEEMSEAKTDTDAEGLAHSDNDNEDDDDAEEDYTFAVILEGHDSEIKSVSWSRYGTYLATCSRDKSVWIWESLDGANATGMPGLGDTGDDDDNLETVAVLQEHDGDVKCVAWHPTDETCLASGSYDEMARIWREDVDGEWSCVGVLDGHDGTIWCVAWEPWPRKAAANFDTGNTAESNGMNGAEADVHAAEDNGGPSRPESGPRILTASADKSIRIWRRRPKTPQPAPSEPRMPSVLRSTNDEETWDEVGVLPQVHERAVYAVAWSETSGRVVSAGSDGRIVIYEEVFSSGKNPSNEAALMKDADGAIEEPHSAQVPGPASSWKVIAEVEAAHGVFEVNHVCWVPRWDHDKKDGTKEEEVIVTTGDDGEVRVWALEEIESLQ